MDSNLFMIFRKDRNEEYKKRGGGVLMAIDRDIVGNKLDVFDMINHRYNFVDILGVKIKHKIFTIYTSNYIYIFFPSFFFF